jgi:2-polyprenyl-6-methoxyphenol hydroxylase-like FAD-dependent oxidoreductase
MTRFEIWSNNGTVSGMTERAVLISGAGIAGTTLAYWLAQHGFRPTIVERAAGQRSSGNPIDVRGPAVEVAERMGVMDRIRAAGTNVAGMTFVNGAGRRVGRVNGLALQRAAGSREVELPRADLAAILLDASKDRAEVLFGDAITALEQDADRVEVTFQHAAPARFDLVIGADGLHSVVRGLAFGPESAFTEHLGVYVATMPLGEPSDWPTEVVMYNAPGRSVTIHPARGEAIVAFIYRGPAVEGFDYRDMAQHKALLAEAYQGQGWRVPELLERVRATDDLYFDSVSMVRLPLWSEGRVAVVGDAASCVSLFGDGSTLAMAGAYVLADELAASPGDPTGAFQRYEARHRKLVEPKQRNAGLAATLLVPASRTGIVVRNLATHLWPVVAGVNWLRGRFTGEHG